MYKGFKRSGLLALGAGTFAYIYHERRSAYTLAAAANQQNESDKALSTNQQLPQDGFSSQNDIEKLKLQQVQVMFRHGARTTLHLIPKIQEANYDPGFLMREHQASLFPSDRLYYGTEKSAVWSDYEVKLSQAPLKSGVPTGALTAYGKDQAYVLGIRLKHCYRDKLNLATYSPQDVLVLSSNIKRTVETAHCVLAGFFTKNDLQDFARKNSPIKIYVPEKRYNFLVPDTDNCAVLKKVNHAGMLHSDFIPGFKADRLKVQKIINDVRNKNIGVVEMIQSRIEKICGSSGLADYKSSHHELALLIEERSEAIERVGRFWGYAVSLDSFCFDYY